MVKRRRLRGKKLLVASASLAGVSVIAGCGDDSVANLVAPPDGGQMDANDDMDDGGDVDVIDFPDAIVANLVAPPDGGEGVDVIDFPDAIVANLVAPPDGGDL